MTLSLHEWWWFQLKVILNSHFFPLLLLLLLLHTLKVCNESLDFGENPSFIPRFFSLFFIISSAWNYCFAVCALHALYKFEFVQYENFTFIHELFFPWLSFTSTSSLSLWWLFILSCWESAVIDEIGWLWNYARLFSSFHNCNNDNLLFFSLFHLVHKMIKVMSGKMRKVNIKLRSPEHEMELAWKMNRPNH